MRRIVYSTVFLFLFFSYPPVMADFPISTSNNWELSPAVAYNTRSNEYLVVWTQVTAIYPFFGPVYGQRISPRGTLLGQPFTIVDNGGVRPSVAYNPDRNEYCVAAEAFLNTEIRMITADGQVKDFPVIKRLGFTYPQVLYNTLDNTYLLVGIDVDAVTPGSDQCHRKILATKFSPSGDFPTPWHEIRELSDDLCTAGESIAIDFAPINRPKTPNGRYMIALGDNPASLKMLNDEGQRIPVVYNISGVPVSDTVPFKLSKIGTPHSVDVSFGYWNDEPSFLLVWSDSDPDINLSGWTWDSGIVGGIVDAEEDYYRSYEGVSNTIFPISWIFWHNDLPSTYLPFIPLLLLDD